MLRTQLHIDSDQRETNSNSETDFRIKITPQLRRIKRISLIEAEIPNATYLIRAGVNDQIDITQSAVTYNITLTEQNYSATSLASALQTAINATALAGFTVTFDSQTLKFTITDDAIFDIEATTNMNVILGYSALPLTGAVTYTGNNVGNVSNAEYWFIKSNILSSGMRNRPIHDKKESSNLYKIPVTAGAGGVIFYQPTMPLTFEYVGDKMLDEIDIQLVYKNGEIVNNNGIEWSFHMLIETSN